MFAADDVMERSKSMRGRAFPHGLARYVPATRWGKGAAFRLVIMLMLAGLLLAAAGLLTPRVGRAWFDPPLYPAPNERLGFGVTRGIENVPASVLNELHAGWYVNWGAAPDSPHPNMLRYIQIIRLTPTSYTPSGKELIDIIERNPGSLWLIGNEPDSPLQDNQTPEQYVQKYHELYTLIKKTDPTALVAIGGVIQATPLRLRYLDLIWQEYKERYGVEMPVDVWNVHNFILREARVYCGPGGIWGAYIPPGLPDDCGEQYTINDHDNMDIFRHQIYAFRQWMKEKGQQNKPLIVSEYGILFPEELGFTEERVERFMLATFDFFLNERDPNLGYPLDDGRLVQQWAWFSLDETSFEWGTTHSALYDSSQGKLTPLGQAFGAYAAQLWQPYTDLYPGPPRISAATPVPFGGEGTLYVDVPVYNDGNTPGSGTLYLDRVTVGGKTIPVGSENTSQVPPRFSGEREVRFIDKRPVNKPLRYRARVTSPEDAREGNNQATVTVPLDVGIARFMVATGYTPDQTPATIHATAVISNATSIPFADVPVRVVRAQAPEEVLASGSVDLLPAHGEGQVSLSWLQSAETQQVQLQLDPDNRVLESNEANNMAEAEARLLPYRLYMPVTGTK